EIAFQRRHLSARLGLGLVVLHRALELAEVLEPTLRFRGVLVFERLLVAALREHHAEYVGGRTELAKRARRTGEARLVDEALHELAELTETLPRRSAEVFGEVVELLQRF